MSQRETIISGAKGDVIGVNVSGSGNIIGKDISIYQQSIDFAKISCKTIKVNANEVNASLHQLADNINLKLHENNEIIPFVSPNDYQQWKSTDKLLLYGRSGSGKSRTVFEIIKDRILEFDRLYVISPHNLTEGECDKFQLSNLINKISENGLIIWDNFPNGVLQGEINIEHGLEILINISKVKHFIVSINPLRLELYKKHIWKLREYLAFHEINYGLSNFHSLVQSYGEGISRYREIYRSHIGNIVHDISKILVNKEPTPLAVLRYYEKLYSIGPDKSKRIDDGFVIKLAQEFLIPSEYYSGQFVDISKDRPRDAEFLYVLNLCYDLGLETTIRRLDELQREIFGSTTDNPSSDLSTWVYTYDKHYFMYDIARNSIIYPDHQKYKLMNYLVTKKFLASLPSGSRQLFGLFIGEQLLFLESDSPNHFLPINLQQLIEPNEEFENGLATGISKVLLTLKEDIVEKVFGMVKERKNFAYSLGQGLGFSLVSIDDNINLDRESSGSNGKKLVKIAPPLESRLLRTVRKNLEFGKGLGYGLGYNLEWLEKSFQDSVFDIIIEKSILEKIFGRRKDFAYSLGCGLGQNLIESEVELQKRIFNIAENREYFGHGVGFGLAERFLLLDNNVQNKILKAIQNKKNISYGLGNGLGYTYLLHSESTRSYILQIGLENKSFRAGLGKGLCNDFGRFSGDIVSKIDTIYRIDYIWRTSSGKVRYTSIKLHPRIKVKPTSIDVQDRIPGFLIYENESINICIQYPIEWEIIEKENLVVFRAPKVKTSGKYKTRIWSSSEDNADSLSEYLEETIGEYKKESDDFCIVKSDVNAVLANHKAYELVYTTNSKKTNIKTIEVGTVIGMKAYFIAYETKLEAFEEFLDVFSKMKNSFSILH